MHKQGGESKNTSILQKLKTQCFVSLCGRMLNDRTKRICAKINIVGGRGRQKYQWTETSDMLQGMSTCDDPNTSILCSWCPYNTDTTTNGESCFNVRSIVLIIHIKCAMWSDSLGFTICTSSRCCLDIWIDTASKIHYIQDIEEEGKKAYLVVDDIT